MVKIIDRPPSFGEMMGRAAGEGLASGIGAFGDEISGRIRRSGEDKALKKMGIDLRGIRDPEMRKIAFGEMLKNRREASEAQAEQQGLRDTLDWLDENAKYTGLTGMEGLIAGNPQNFLGSLPGTEAYGKRKEIDASGFWAADQIYTHFNKGQISEQKLKVIQNDLAPRAGLTQKEFKARVSAMRRISALPRNAPRTVVEKEIEKERKALKKIGSGSTDRPDLQSFWR